jgi:transcription antitermination protein NusB
VSESRRGQRRAAVFLLYQRDLTGTEFGPLYEAHERDNGRPPGEFARSTAEAVWADRERLDAVIDAAADDWTAERMAVLERNILRLGVWELTAGEVPAAVAIDEAVTLSKRYASPEAGALVHGVLGRVAREQEVER